MSDVKTAESLWGRAHEQVKRGDFAGAVRDLAQCFQILQGVNDPRVYEVHRRWTEVHQMYLEDGQRQERPAPQKAPSVEAEAETAANAGDLDRAIALYRQAIQQSPDNELITERLLELTQAKERANELTTGKAKAPAPSSQASADDDWSDVGLEDSAKTYPAKAAAVQPAAQPAAEAAVVQPAAQAAVAQPAAQPAVTSSAVAAGAPRAVTGVPESAPTMRVEDAPVGMQSLDVSFSVGEAIDSFTADDLPVAGAASTPPRASASSSSGADVPMGTDAQIALLEELSARVKQNRRQAA